MIWTFAGAMLITYQIAALASGWPHLSRLAHTRPWALLVWSWWALLGLHFVTEWRREELA